MKVHKFIYWLKRGCQISGEIVKNNALNKDTSQIQNGHNVAL